MLIVTKYLGPSTTRSSRIKATVYGGELHGVSRTVEWDYQLNVFGNHQQAVFKLRRKLASIDPDPKHFNKEVTYVVIDDPHRSPSGGYIFAEPMEVREATIS